MKRKAKTYSGYYPVPLPTRLRHELMTWASDQVSKLAGEGELIAHHKPDGGMYLVEVSEYVLPLEYWGVMYLVRYTYTRENGCVVEDICQGVK